MIKDLLATSWETDLVTLHFKFIDGVFLLVIMKVLHCTITTSQVLSIFAILLLEFWVITVNCIQEVTVNIILINNHNMQRVVQRITLRSGHNLED